MSHEANGESLEWLLHQQRNFAAELKHKRRSEAQPASSGPQPSTQDEEPVPKKARSRTAEEVLLQAFVDGRHDVADFLLEQGVTLAQPSAHGALAAEAFITALLLAGPDDLARASGTTAEAGAAGPSTARGSQGLEGAATAGDTPEQAAATAHSAKLLLKGLPPFLSSGMDVNHSRQDGVTPLLAAVHRGAADVVRLLLSAGADADPGLEHIAAAATPAATGRATAAAAAAGAAAGAASSRGGGGGPPGSGSAHAAKGSAGQPSPAAQQRQSQQRRKGKQGKPAPEAAQKASAKLCTQPSPLVLACRRGHPDIAHLLLDAFADENRATVPDIHLSSPAASGAVAPGADAQQQAGGSSGGSGGNGADRQGQDPLEAAGGLCTPMTPLMAAASCGSAELVEFLLKAGAGVHRCPSKDSRCSALWLAMESGCLEVVRLLAEAGACRGTAGRWISPKHPAPAALAQAAALGRVDLVELLYPRVLDSMQGGDQSIVGQLGRHETRHPLAAAAEQGQEAVVSKLLELGSSPSSRSSRRKGYSGYTPLMLAAGKGHSSIVEQLLSAGATVGSTNEREECAASLALQGGFLDIASRLLQASKDAEEREAQLRVMARKWHSGFAPGMAPTKQSSPPPLEQVEREREVYRRLIPLLLEQQQECARGVPPSLVARAAAGSAALLDKLVACGASVSGSAYSASAEAGTAVDWSAFAAEKGAFPLLHAVWFGWEAVARLLEAGADVNEASSDGSCLLLVVAARPGLAPLGEQLLCWPGLELQRRDRQGRDAVGLAIQRKNPRFGTAVLRRLMVEAGGGGGGEPAEHLAKAAFDALAAHAQDIKALGDINSPDPATGDTPLLKLVRAASVKAVRQLLAVPGLDVNVGNTRTGCTPLMEAAEGRQVAIVQALLGTGRGAVNAVDARGTTALLHAARKRDVALVRLLLAAGADTNLSDNHGDTPLMALARGGQHKIMLELVKQHGAALDVQDSDGMTALHYAAAVGSFNTVKVLRSLGADHLAKNHAGQAAYELALSGDHAVVLKIGAGADGEGGSGEGGVAAEGGGDGAGGAGGAAGS